MSISIPNCRARLALLVALAFLGPDLAMAWPSCGNEFNAEYPDSQTFNNSDCQTCHQEPGNGNNFNVYGAAIIGVVNDQGLGPPGFGCTDIDFRAVLRAVEGLDSDNEGNNNRVEIDASTQPGWCDETQSASCTNSAGTPPAGVPLDPVSQPVNTPPVANAGGPYSGEAGNTPIQFDGSASSDADNDPLMYAWDFGDGTVGSGVMPTHTYTAAGDFTVTLVVNDGQADSDPAEAPVAITPPPANVAPTARPGGPYVAEPGQPVTFDGSASSDPNGDPLSYLWNFGDGMSGDGAAPSHTYTMAGTYTASLVVNDGALDSAAATATVTVTDAPADQSDGEVLYETNCLGCHGDPWAAPAVDDTLPGLRRVAGSRACTIFGSIFGTSVFPNGVPGMQFLQGLTEAEIAAIADYLNARESTGEQRYVAGCAGCHGNFGAGGRTDEDVHGDSAEETIEAIYEENEMQFLACLPHSDIDAITEYLMGFDDDNDDDGIDDDEDHDDDNDGIDDDADHDDDNDGIDDDDEREYGTDPRDSDSDDDDVDDGQEREDGTDPMDPDSDDDGLDDGEERDHRTDPNDADTDNDGVSDGREVKMFGTDPLVADSTATASSADSGAGALSPLLLLLIAAGALAARTMRVRATRRRYR